jgi:hypothetical protein
MKRKIIWSSHSREIMKSRRITKDDVINCILYGCVIEDYPYTRPYPECLVYGKMINGKAIHVVVGTDNRYLYIITTYFPSKNKFEEDLKTRRR